MVYTGKVRLSTAQSNRTATDTTHPNGDFMSDADNSGKLPAPPQGGGNKLSNQPDPIDTLLTKIQAGLRGGTDKATQIELQRLISLLPDLRLAGDPDLIHIAETIASALICTQPNLELAARLNDWLIRRFRTPRAIFHTFFGHNPAGLVVAGVSFLIYITLPVLFMFFNHHACAISMPSFDTGLFMLIAAAGFCGSIVSILVRIQEFAKLQFYSGTVLLLTGFSRPIIGAFFAMFVCALYKSGIVNASVTTEHETYFLLAIGFISGFSERFARDLISTAEGRFGKAAQGSTTKTP